MLALYRGFSLHEYRSRQTTQLTDIELVKMNLLTHIYTSKGERLMMSDFGTRIPELVFEPLTEQAIEIVREDLTAVVKYDPRVELEELVITPLWDESCIIASLRIRYIELNLTDTVPLRIEFDAG
jgi:phage baseplate assembly protein W